MYQISRFTHRGTAGAGASRISGADNATALSTVAAAIDTLWAFPVLLQAGSLDTLGFQVTGAGGAGNKVRAAIFSNKQDGILYPDKFLGSGFLSSEGDGTATGVKETTIASPLDQGLYWFVYTNGAGTVATVAAHAVADISPILGLTVTPAKITGISVAATYNSTFTSMLTSSAGSFLYPSGGAYVTAAMPAMWVKYSS